MIIVRIRMAVDQVAFLDSFELSTILAVRLFGLQFQFSLNNSIVFLTTSSSDWLFDTL
jgi:hypothetical protein